MTITEKVAYVRGLMEGLDLDADKKEVKVLNAVIELLDDMAATVSELEEGYQDMADQLDEVDADLGDLDGKRGLAICYQYGSGVPQSDETAFALNLELAQANYGAGVYYEVADAYTDGRGTARNPEQAIYWWNRYLETGSTTFIDPDKVRAKIAELEGAQ